MLRTKITIASILTIVYFLPVSCQVYGVSECSPWWTHFTYQFFHGSLLHLICNLYAIFMCLNNKVFSKRTLIPILYFVSVAASFMYTSSIPTIGASGVVFAMIGINFTRIPTRTNAIYMFVILAVGLALPKIAGITHLLSFMAGSATALFYQNIKHFKHDIR